MMGLIRARQQRQVETGKTHCVAAYTCLIIVHLVLIHTLHLALPSESSMAHYQVAGTHASHASVASSESAGNDISCSAPNFVSQRVETVVITASMSPLPEVIPELPQSPVSLRADCDPPRPPGPTRQALLQRFTL